MRVLLRQSVELLAKIDDLKTQLKVCVCVCVCMCICVFSPLQAWRQFYSHGISRRADRRQLEEQKSDAIRAQCDREMKLVSSAWWGSFSFSSYVSCCFSADLAARAFTHAHTHKCNVQTQASMQTRTRTHRHAAMFSSLLAGTTWR